MANDRTGADGPRITVVIPTRERADVFASALKTVTVQDYGNLDILVSDNFSGDATAEIAQSTGDSRVRYLNTGRRLSMSHNWEFALSHIADGWVTIVGDDDGLLPGSLQKVAALIRSTGTLALQSATCRYRWPGNKGRRYGRIRIPMKTGHETRDSRSWMSKVLRARASYAELPMLYTGGFTSMSALNEIKQKSGAFYGSRIPDVYSAFATASLVPSYVYSHTPFAIGGISRHSIGIDQFAGGKKAAESPSQKFQLEENIAFHKDIPMATDGGLPKSLQAVVFESYLQTAHLRPEGCTEPFARQIELALATSPRGDTEIEQWAASFARMHGLDYSRIRFRATLRRIEQKILDAPRNFERRINRRTIGSPQLPIENVYEASLAAAAVLDRAKKN